MAFLLHQSAGFAGRLSGPSGRITPRFRNSRVHQKRISFSVRAESSKTAEDKSTESAAVPTKSDSSAKKPGVVAKVNAEELEVAIQNRDKPMVVDFYADWCGPCVLMADELVKVAEEMGDAVQILKIDTEANSELSSQLKIQGLPTLMFISTEPGKPALRVEGLVPAKTVKDIIENEL